MSDLNRPEQPVYRPSRGGMDPATKRLSIIACGIGAVLVALVGGWSLTGHRAGGIPVIEAPTGPMRVKPADPGGMQLMGAEPPPSTADGGTTSLAPGPEKPDPQALAAELDRARKDDAASEPATKSPVATKPAPPPAPAPVAPPPKAAEAAPPATGRVEVQLAAMDTQAQAEAEWARLSRKDPSLFADRAPVIVPASRDGRTFYRLRTGGFETVAAATGFCARSRAAGAACTIAAF